MIATLRKHPQTAPAIIDSFKSRSISYGELCDQAERVAQHFLKLSGRPLIFLYSDNSADSLIAYLACLFLKIPVCLLESTTSGFSGALLQSYGNPCLVFPLGMEPPKNYFSMEQIPGISYCLAKPRAGEEFSAKIHPDLVLLLQTSGSTGNPKLVRLSWKNAYENARSIIKYLKITPQHRSIQSLPMSYSYGLSLIHSHLIAGATVVLSSHSFMRPEFWQDFDQHACTSFAGVPFMYETLEKLRFRPADHPTLKIMTQAGGGLRVDVAKSFMQKTKECEAFFYVMYGQTEAAARIAYVPPEKLEEKLGSIGIAIPGGKIELAEVPGSHGSYELIYFGPNVMMGYAENLASLALGDELQGRLATGDLARVDDEGYYYVEGRLKRFAKIFGLRIHLEDLERRLEEKFSLRAAAVDGGHKIQIFVESDNEIEIEKIQSYLASWLQLTPKALFVRQVAALPMSSSGKKDYAKLISQ